MRARGSSLRLTDASRSRMPRPGGYCAAAAGATFARDETKPGHTTGAAASAAAATVENARRAMSVPASAHGLRDRTAVSSSRVGSRDRDGYRWVVRRRAVAGEAGVAEDRD